MIVDCDKVTGRLVSNIKHIDESRRRVSAGSLSDEIRRWEMRVFMVAFISVVVDLVICHLYLLSLACKKHIIFIMFVN